VLTATTTDGYSVNIESTKPATMLAVMVNSPCFKSPTPR
jgi:hypothetical protein